jgi:GAF domain-containing protein
VDDHVQGSLDQVHAFISGECGLVEALNIIASHGTAALGADMAGLTLNDSAGRATTVVYTDRMVPEIDQAQYDSDRGPCLHALRSQSNVLITDVSTDERFPEYAVAAARHGIHATVSVPLCVAGHGIGALNFYDHRPGHFDALPSGGDVFAQLSAIVAAYYDRAEEADNLQRAIESRSTIEQAKGIIMATSGCTPDRAFDLLREQSQAENRKLRTIAEEIVASQERHP